MVGATLVSREDILLLVVVVGKLKEKLTRLKAKDRIAKRKHPRACFEAGNESGQVLQFVPRRRHWRRRYCCCVCRRWAVAVALVFAEQRLPQHSPRRESERASASERPPPLMGRIANVVVVDFSSVRCCLAAVHSSSFFL